RWITFLLVTFNECQGCVQSGAFGYTLWSLSSPDLDMRKLGYEFLAQFYKRFMTTSYQKFKERTFIWRLCDALKNGITAEFQQIPRIMCSMLSSATSILIHPEHKLFLSIVNWISQQP